MKAKQSLAMVMAGAMAFSLAACGGAASSTSTADAAQSTGTTEAASSEKLVTIDKSTSETVSGDYTPEDGATIEVFTVKEEVVSVMDEIIKNFEAKYPQVTVTQTAVDDGETVLKTRITSNDVPDITQVYPGDSTYSAYYEAGYLADLTDEPFMANVQQSLLDMTDDKGVQFSLPITVSTYGIYYRKDLFEKAGITAAPTTYDELLADLKTLQDSGIECPVAFDFKGSANQITERLLGALNPDCANDFQKVADGSEDVKDSPTLKAYLDFLDAVKPYATKDALGMDRDAAVQDIVNGKSALMFNGSWLLSEFLKADANIDIGYCAIPSPLLDTPQVPVNVDTAWSMSATTKYPEACKAFLNYMAQSDVEQKYYEVDGNINMVKGVNYDKTQLMDVYNTVMDGNSFLTVGNQWPTWDLRADLAAAAQGYYEDGNRDTFFEASGEAIDTYYNK
jgi:raffinose/stachyose/melibiose transport system substrate-binding protein